LVAAKKYNLAYDKLVALTQCVKNSSAQNVEYGFNEWIKAQDGKPKGQDWQTWSAAMYLYAAKCVEDKCTPYFDIIEKQSRYSLMCEICNYLSNLCNKYLVCRMTFDH
jgi:hypothetical protein